MTIEVRAVTGDADLETFVAVSNAAAPEEPVSFVELRWAEASYPGGVRFLATLDGRPVGAGSAGRIYVHPPEFDGYWGTVVVVPDARRQGVGARLLDVVSRAARDVGKTWLHVPTSDEQPVGTAFLEHRGYVIHERNKAVRLVLDAATVQAVEAVDAEPPGGIELTTLEARPDLVLGVHTVALEAFADIPGGEEPMAAGDLEEFRRRDVDRPGIPHWGFVVAVDTTTDQVVGYASLLVQPGAPETAWHDMTAVLRTHRGRGLARAMKIVTIRAAARHGLADLRTGNDVDNVAMRAVNARLGYRPIPDLLTMRGPVAAGIMEP